MLTHDMYVATFLSLVVVAFSSTNSESLSVRYNKNRIAYSTVYVNPSGSGHFKTIQSAIDSVPPSNRKWICIHVKKGVYREKITIPRDKPFIYLKGEGKRNTYVVWDAHESIATSATFTSNADNTIAKCITFVNSYNSPMNGNPIRTAVAALIQGDKSVFHRCGFIGFQDTLWDVQGRHYFKQCTIQGAIDFIFGAGQSLYERCTISVVAGALNGYSGYITAQGRSNDQETNGFVFKECKIDGNGTTYLGRPWRDHAKVLFYNTIMSQIVVPQGWDPWFSTGHENQLIFAEHNCRGLGSNTSGRVNWIKRLSEKELNHLTSFSFIDNDGWMTRLIYDIFSSP